MEGTDVKVLMRAIRNRSARKLLVCGSLLAGLTVAASASAAGSSATAGSTNKGAWNFVSAPGLHPTKVHISTRKAHEAPGLIFAGPFGSSLAKSPFVGQAGALMMDQGGRPVWFHPAPKKETVFDFQAQQFAGQPVLTFWQGHLLSAGAPGKGAFYVYNDHYKLVKVIKAKNGWTMDLHELLLTKATTAHPQGTAWFLAAKRVSKNLTKFGGPRKGALEDYEIQELDLKTGKLMFQWDALKHIPLKTSEVHPKTGVWDPYHANSLDLTPSGKVLVSLRNTWGGYEIDSSSGKFVWQVNGKCAAKLCMQPTKQGKFFWQHDIKFIPGSTSQISVFDDACCNPNGGFPAHHPRGLVLQLKLKKKSATVVRQYHHSNLKAVLSQGNLQKLSDGHVFIGWGQPTSASPFFSEFTASGKMLFDGAFPKPDISYRVLKYSWKGLPSYPPSAVVRKTTVYASWNGATTVASWKVLGGKSKGSQTKSVGKATRNGFETAIHLSGHDKYYKVEALDGHGKVLGSKVIKG
jgi:hypothetical protein